MFLVAVLVPPRFWYRIASFFAPVANMLALKKAESRKHVRDLMGDQFPDTTPEAVENESMARFVELNLRTFRLYARPDWQPRLEISGEQHLRDALAQGRGVVLWKAFFSHASLLTYMALHEAGYDVTALSHPAHGFSNSAFAIRFLNPSRSKIEDRYLKGRATLGQDDPSGALLALARELRANGIVTIAAIAWSADPVTVRFLAGEIELAPGAPHLAALTGATLLPLIPIQRGLDDYVIHIEPPIELDANVPARERSETAAREFGARIEKYVRAYPGQWRGWQTHRRR